MNIIPTGAETTRETYDFYFETAEPTELEWQAIDYVRDVLQREDIDLVESVQRGMNTPAFEQGRIVHDPADVRVERARRAPLPRAGARCLPARLPWLTRSRERPRWSPVAAAASVRRSARAFASEGAVVFAADLATAEGRAARQRHLRRARRDRRSVLPGGHGNRIRTPWLGSTCWSTRPASRSRRPSRKPRWTSGTTSSPSTSPALSWSAGTALPAAAQCRRRFGDQLRLLRRLHRRSRSWPPTARPRVPFMH